MSWNLELGIKFMIAATDIMTGVTDIITLAHLHDLMNLLTFHYINWRDLLQLTSVNKILNVNEG